MAVLYDTGIAVMDTVVFKCILCTIDAVILVYSELNVIHLLLSTLTEFD